MPDNSSFFVAEIHRRNEEPEIYIVDDLDAMPPDVNSPITRYCKANWWDTLIDYCRDMEYSGCWRFCANLTKYLVEGEVTV